MTEADLTSADERDWGALVAEVRRLRGLIDAAADDHGDYERCLCSFEGGHHDVERHCDALAALGAEARAIRSERA